MKSAYCSLTKIHSRPKQLHTCELETLVERCLRGVHKSDGYLGFLRGDQSYSQALFTGQFGTQLRLSHVWSTLTICPAPTTPNLLTGVDEELYCLN